MAINTTRAAIKLLDLCHGTAGTHRCFPFLLPKKEFPVAVWYKPAASSSDIISKETAFATEKQANTWFKVNPLQKQPPTNRKGKTKSAYIMSQMEYIKDIGVLFAEFDNVKDKWKTTAKLLELAIQPMAIVDSGGGLHVYYALDKRITVYDNSENLERMRTLQSNLVIALKRHGSDQGAKDLTRHLRLPGVPNRKPKYGEKGAPVEFLYTNFGAKNTLEQVDLFVSKVVKRQQKSKEYEQKLRKKRITRQAKNNSTAPIPEETSGVVGLLNWAAKQITELKEDDSQHPTYLKYGFIRGKVHNLLGFIPPHDEPVFDGLRDRDPHKHIDWAEQKAIDSGWTLELDFDGDDVSFDYDDFETPEEMTERIKTEHLAEGGTIEDCNGVLIFSPPSSSALVERYGPIPELDKHPCEPEFVSHRAASSGIHKKKKSCHKKTCRRCRHDAIAKLGHYLKEVLLRQPETAWHFKIVYTQKERSAVNRAYRDKYGHRLDAFPLPNGTYLLLSLTPFDGFLKSDNWLFTPDLLEAMFIGHKKYKGSHWFTPSKRELFMMYPKFDYLPLPHFARNKIEETIEADEIDLMYMPEAVTPVPNKKKHLSVSDAIDEFITNNVQRLDFLGNRLNSVEGEDWKRSKVLVIKGREKEHSDNLIKALAGERVPYTVEQPVLYKNPSDIDTKEKSIIAISDTPRTQANLLTLSRNPKVIEIEGHIPF